MLNVINKFRNSYYYAVESIKNRYPCKIVKVKNLNNSKSKINIIYQAVTRLNINEISLEELISDPREHYQFLAPFFTMNLLIPGKNFIKSSII
jgi:hypothetical protein